MLPPSKSSSRSISRRKMMQKPASAIVRKVPDDEREFMRLDELKPHQLTELGVVPLQQQQQQQKHQQQHAGQQITNNESGVVVVHQHQPQQHQSQKTQHVPNGNLQSQTFHQHGYYEISSGPPSPPLSNSCNQNNYLSNNNNNNNNDLIVQQQTHMCLSSHMSSDGNGTTDANDQKYHRHGSSSSARKRKLSLTDPSDVEDGDDAKSVRTVDDNKKQNHSEIEKRRRDKMNQFIGELSSMIPMCHAMSRKLDKLTVLRMAVQHIRTIRGAVHSYTENYKPAFLSDQELKMLILQAAEGFLFVVGCDRGRILYVSESVSKILNYSPSDLLGQSWFDILHPKDVAKVKEQLSSSDSSPRERLIDAKTMLPVKATDVPQGVSKLCLGARRSFFCRMKYKATTQIKEETEISACHRRKKQQNQDKKYSVIQCTGYLKSWAPAKIGVEEQEIDGDGELGTLSCLVAVGRVQPNIFSNTALKSGGTGDNNNTTTNNNNNNNSQGTRNGDRDTNIHRNLRNIQFISRHAMDGKFLFVDQRATLVLGFLPQELLGTSMYEYYHHLDLPALAESHKAVLQTCERVTTPIYRQRSKHNGFIRMQSELKSFRNPWTKELEYLIAKNNVILSEFGCIEGNVDYASGQGSTPNSTNGAEYRTEGNSVSNYEFFNQSNGREIHRMINNHVEAAKIGRQIAEQVLDYQRRVGDSSSESSPDLERHSTSNHNHNLDTTTSGSSTEYRSPHLFQTGPGRINGSLPSYSRSESHLLPDNVPDSEIISIITNQASQRQINGLTQPLEGASSAALAGDAVADDSGGGGTGQSDQGNDEAAMAVIMSLLEADAGLGGPVDFSGLPWPLP